MRAGRASRELREVTDEVRLIGVATHRRRVCAALRRIELLEHSQRALETRDAGQTLRRDADSLLELPFEMAWRHTNVGGESIHRDETTGVVNAIHSRVYVTINPADVRASGQDLLSDPRGIGRVTPTLSRRIKLLRQRKGQRMESCRVPHETILWLGKQRSGAMRPQPDADDCDAPSRAQIERTKQLTGKDDRCLALPISAHGAPDGMDHRDAE